MSLDKHKNRKHEAEEIDDFEFIDLDADEIDLDADEEEIGDMNMEEFDVVSLDKPDTKKEPTPRAEKEPIKKATSIFDTLELEDLELEDPEPEELELEKVESDEENDEPEETLKKAKKVQKTAKHGGASKDYSFGERIRTYFTNLFSNFTKLEWMMFGTGVCILVAALVVVGVFIKRSSSPGNSEVMAQTGQQLVDIGMAGQSGFVAVTDAYLARQAEIVPEEPDVTPEADGDEVVEVRVTFTSVEKDLKIKFVNDETGKLVNNARFSVTLTGSDGKEKTYTDDDMDGIIYQSPMTPGEYEVSVEAPENYEIVSCDRKTSVRDTIVYEQIDVVDEIKDESQINVATEDTQINIEIKEETVTGNLTDTVEWVESTKVTMEGADDYAQVDKSTIQDPAQIASRSFWKLAASTGGQEGEGGETTPTVKPTEKPTEPPTETPTETPTPTNPPTPTPTETPTDPPTPAEVKITGIDIKIDPSSVSMKVNESTTLSASVTVKKSDGSSSTGEYTWSSSDSTVAKVDGGKVTALKAGTATITVTSKDTVDGKTVSASCTVNVSDVIMVKSFTLNQTSATLTIGKDTLTLTPTVTMSDNKTDTSGSNITWSSSDSKVAKVENGKVTPLAAGKTTITAVYKDSTGKEWKAECAVTVNGTLSIQLDQEKATIAVGAKLKLTATVNKNGTATTSGTEGVVTWSTSDKSIATVNEKTGEVTGVKAGTATITATSAEKDASGNPVKASCTVTVTNGTLEIKLDKDTLSIYTEAKVTLTATVKKNGTTLTSATEGVVTWSTSDKSIATVNEKTGEITGVKAGTVTITATTVDKTAEGKQLSVSCTVTVKTNPAKDTVTKLRDKNGNQVYIMDASGKYVEATYADYYTATKFYIKTQVTYKYTGWQTINNRTYYYTKEGIPVTGEQIIQGVKYTFGSDGALSMGDGSFGIDVSKWNGTIDWNAVKNSGVSFVIIRCGYRGSTKGALVEDATFRRNIEGATAAGLKVGVYFFTQAVNEVEAVEEASMVLSLVKNYKISYPIFIDTEACGGRADGISKETRTAVCRAFCETIRNGGYTPGIYASKSWFNDKLNTSSLNSYTIWLAQYATTPTYTGRYDLWQYSSKGSINGISGNVDLNYSYLGY